MSHAPGPRLGLALGAVAAVGASVAAAWVVTTRPSADSAALEADWLGGPLVVTPAPATAPGSTAATVSGPPVADPTTAGSTADIGLAAAIAVALTHAGVPEGDESIAQSTRGHRAMENGFEVYEVEFYYAGTEYDYDIAVATGAIIEFDYDSDSDDPWPSLTAPPAGGILTEAAAGDIVLARVPGARVEDLRISLDYENNRAIWEGSVVHDHTEFEFELDATTGEVLDWEAEWYPYG
ncbi:MAG: PepSY domain-containing protein [Propionibacteriaceae bacterium]|jgi:uncharacterized membrane protein YkoI|nr:PepSY domain-containing protein [Propionibacteriaceae bacterium]